MSDQHQNHIYSNSPPPRSGGRLGNPETRQLNNRIANLLKGRGWEITGGGGIEPEEYLPPLGSGRTGANYVDITATRNGQTLRINTVDTYANGLPTDREAAAAALISAKKPNDPLVLIPKGTSDSDLGSFLGN